MQAEKTRRLSLILCITLFVSPILLYGKQNQDDSEMSVDDDFAESPERTSDGSTGSLAPVQVPRRINQIVIVGNAFTPTAAIMNYIPYHVGEIFDPQKSSMLIRNLYTSLKRFRNITLKGVFVDDDLIDLYVIVAGGPFLPSDLPNKTFNCRP